MQSRIFEEANVPLVFPLKNIIREKARIVSISWVDHKQGLQGFDGCLLGLLTNYGFLAKSTFDILDKKKHCQAAL